MENAMFNRSASVDREVSKSRGAGRSSVFAGILTATVLFLSLNREALAEDSPPEPSGHVLLYTDNTPGAIVYAHGHLWAANRQNYDVHVVTNVDDFVSALPTMSWNYYSDIE